MAVPNIFATKTGTIPLSELDANFATPITIGATPIILGQTAGTITGLTLAGTNLGTPASGTLTNCTFPTLNQNTTGTASNVTGIVIPGNGGTGVTTSTGTGSVVLNTSPTLVTPILGTPSSGTLTNCTLPQLSASTGSTLVGTINGGTGAVTRTVASKLNDTVSVKDFGAVGDGVTNDTAAIQAAIDSRAVLGGEVFLPAGSYLITAPLLLTLDGVSLIGEGFGNNVDSDPTVASRLILNFNSSATFGSGYGIKVTGGFCSVKYLEITSSDTRWAYAASTSLGGIYIVNAIGFTLDKIQVYRSPGVGVYVATGSPSSVMSQVSVIYAKAHGFVIDNGTMANTAVPGTITLAYAGIMELHSCRANRVNGCGLIIGDPSATDLSVLAALRVHAYNFEAFYMGGSSAFNADYGIKIYGDNCSYIGSAVGAPQDQVGGENTTLGLNISGSTADQLVRGIIIQGRNNRIENLRVIHCYHYGVTITALSTDTRIDGVEARHEGTIGVDDYDHCINVTDGASACYISRISPTMTVNATNITNAKIVSAQEALINTFDGVYNSVDGIYTFIDTSASAFTINAPITLGSTTFSQQFRVGTDVRSLGDVRPITNNTASLGISGARWTEVFAVNGVINTSDKNKKEQIASLSNKELAAWGKINYCKFKMKAAVLAKGDKARWHIGVIAQDIESAFASEGLNAFDYGLLCFDEWEDEYDDEGNIINPAGNLYSVRYDEVASFEAAYLRQMLKNAQI